MIKIRISIKEVTILLLIVVVSMHAIGFAGRTIEYLLGYKGTSAIVRLFHPVEEANIISWISSLLLLCSALLLTIITTAKSSKADPGKQHWRILSIIFFYLSLDEAVSIHELTIVPLRSLFNLGGFFYHSWVLIAIPLLLIFFIYYFKFFFTYLPQKTRYLFAAAGTIFITGALGMEMLGGFVVSYEVKGAQFINPMLITVEELLENVGIVVFINALLSYIKSNLRLNGISLEYL